MNEFKLRDIVINVLPLFLWILLFVADLSVTYPRALKTIAYVLLIFFTPLFLSVYNYLHSTDTIIILLKNGLGTVSGILGMVFAQQLSNHFIQYDYEADPVLKLFIVVLLAFSGLFTLIGCVARHSHNKE